jgi:UDP-galactopyranose mutase
VTSEHQVQHLVGGVAFAGADTAERLATDADKRLLVVDKHMHIGGNASSVDRPGQSVPRNGFVCRSVRLVTPPTQCS